MTKSVRECRSASGSLHGATTRFLWRRWHSKWTLMDRGRGWSTGSLRPFTLFATDLLCGGGWNRQGCSERNPLGSRESCWGNEGLSGDCRKRHVMMEEKISGLRLVWFGHSRRASLELLHFLQSQALVPTGMFGDAAFLPMRLSAQGPRLACPASVGPCSGRGRPCAAFLLDVPCSAQLPVFLDGLSVLQADP